MLDIGFQPALCPLNGPHLLPRPSTVFDVIADVTFQPSTERRDIEMDPLAVSVGRRDLRVRVVPDTVAKRGVDSDVLATAQFDRLGVTESVGDIARGDREENVRRLNAQSDITFKWGRRQ